MRLEIYAALFLQHILFCATIGNIAAKPIHHKYDNFMTLKDVRSLKNDVQSSSTRCRLCKVVLGLVFGVVPRRISSECVKITATYICETLNIGDNWLCNGITSVYIDEFTYVASRLALNADLVCSILIKHCGTVPSNNWNVSLPGNKPPVEKLKSPPAGKPVLKVLHISDLHFDPAYTPGAEADCIDPLCCQSYGGKSPNVSVKQPAGKWGSIAKCDLPKRTIENLFQHLSTQQFDYILWTGDLPPHNVWNQTKTGQLGALDNLTQWFTKYFPSTPIFSAVGNHESVPLDSFPPSFVPDEYSISWLYDKLADQWPQFSVNLDPRAIKRRASYAFEVFPGLKIISINTQYCETYNFWLYLNQTDPDGTLAWLVQQLTQAEMTGVKVHIIGHIPPGDGECLEQWSLNYYKIVNRFESTIRGQFFGHTHTDSYSIFYDYITPYGRPTNMYYVAPSVTTYENLQPAYRVYTIDGNYNGTTWTVLDTATFSMDVNKANQGNNTPAWELEYTAKNAYGLKSLFPADWNSLIKEKFLKPDSKSMQDYAKFYYRRDFECDKFCQYHLLCEIRSAYSGDIDKLCGDIPTLKSQESLEGKVVVTKLLAKIIAGTLEEPGSGFLTLQNVTEICRKPPTNQPVTVKPSVGSTAGTGTVSSPISGPSTTTPATNNGACSVSVRFGVSVMLNVLLIFKSRMGCN